MPSAMPGLGIVLLPTFSFVSLTLQKLSPGILSYFESTEKEVCNVDGEHQHGLKNLG